MASGLLVIVSSFLTIPIVVFAIEVMAGILAGRQQFPVAPRSDNYPTIAVIVPAHNESAGILTTLADIRKQMRSCDRLLVVADNCTDDTGALARAAGADVVERNEPANRGKGFALDWGIQHLRRDPREIVIIVDADCRLGDGALEKLARDSSATKSPVQAMYLMKAPAGSQVNHQVAEFAWRVKNWLRPLGLYTLALPTQLTGTGMAFPWGLVSSVHLANSQIVEDMKLGLDLALAGHPPRFSPSALVTSEFARSVRGSGTQRKRWEQGHLALIFNFAPQLFAAALVRSDPRLLAITLDLTVPPLSLLGLLVLGTFGLSLLAGAFDHSFTPSALASANLLLFATAVLLAWLKCGRDVVPPKALMLIPSYLLGKLKLYSQLALGRTDSDWTRTERTD